VNSGNPEYPLRLGYLKENLRFLEVKGMSDFEKPGRRIRWNLSLGSFLFCAILLLLFAQSALGQIEGQIVVAKKRASVGEPLPVEFQATNIGQQSVEIMVADPYSLCGEYEIKITRGDAMKRTTSGAELPKENEGKHEIATSCFFGSQKLAPRETYIEHILLNRYFERRGFFGGHIDLAHPGSYHVEITRNVAYDRAGVLPHSGSPVLRFHSQFTLVIVNPRK
jgi:hypothetical protein